MAKQVYLTGWGQKDRAGRQGWRDEGRGGGLKAGREGLWAENEDSWEGGGGLRRLGARVQEA